MKNRNFGLNLLTLTTTWFAKVQSYQLHHIWFQEVYIPNEKYRKIYEYFLSILPIINFTHTTMEHVQLLSANTYPMYRMLMLNHRLLSVGFQHLPLKFAWALCQPPHLILCRIKRNKNWLKSNIKLLIWYLRVILLWSFW